MTRPEEAAELLRGAERVLILCHSFPDGDTLGAASALCRGACGSSENARHGAAGCTLPAPLETAEKQIVDAAERYLIRIS